MQNIWVFYGCQKSNIFWLPFILPVWRDYWKNPCKLLLLTRLKVSFCSCARIGMYNTLYWFSNNLYFMNQCKGNLRWHHICYTYSEALGPLVSNRDWLNLLKEEQDPETLKSLTWQFNWFQNHVIFIPTLITCYLDRRVETIQIQKQNQNYIIRH